MALKLLQQCNFFPDEGLSMVAQPERCHHLQCTKLHVPPRKSGRHYAN